MLTRREIDWSNPITRKLALALDGGLQMWPPAGEILGGTRVRPVSGKYGPRESVAFGSVLGNDTSSKLITSGCSHESLLRSYFVHAYRNGSGGGGLGYMLNKAADSSNFSLIAGWDGSSPGIWFRRDTVNAATQWRVNDSISGWATGEWCTWAVTHDTTADSTAPLGYFNGLSSAMNQLIAPNGTWKNNSAPLTVGGRYYDSSRYWDGFIGPVLVFDRILTPAEVFSLNADPWQVFKKSNTRRLYWASSNILLQTVAPTSTISAGSWQSSVPGGGPLYGAVDEEAADDGDYIYTLSDSTVELKFAPVSDPGISSGHTVRYRLKGNGSATIVASLRQGATTEIASWTHVAEPATLTTYAQTLTSGQADNITDYTDLRIRFVTTS